MLCCFVCSVSTFRVVCVKPSENWSRGELGSFENRDNKIVKNHVTTVKVIAVINYTGENWSGTQAMKIDDQ